MKLARVAMASAAGIMGLGLLGVGAHAAFTTTASVTQKFVTGTPGLVIAPYGTTTYAQHLSLPVAGPYGSTFLYSKAVTLKNSGNISETVTKFNGTLATGATLNAANLHACILHGTTVLQTGSITGTFTVNIPLAKTATYSFTINIYAGNPAGLPGSCNSGVSPLPNTTAGKSLTDTFTAYATA